MGAIRAQGNDIEIPSLDDAKKHFDDWLMSEPEPDVSLVSDDKVMRRALGLSER
jgi:hypothetical protein